MEDKIRAHCNYYVYASESNPPPDLNARRGRGLIGAAEAESLKEHFDDLYEQHGIALHPTEDTVIQGQEALSATNQTLLAAISDFGSRPDYWEVHMGFRVEPQTHEIGKPIIEIASRDNLMGFLSDVQKIVERARASDMFVFFCGGE